MALTIDRSLRLPESEFFQTAETKTGICIHHTVGGSAESTYRWWLQDRNREGDRVKVGTAYIIERDGTIHEVFEPAAWAYQFGLPWPAARKLEFEQRFIGIELASEGGLIEHQGQLYCFDRISERTRKPLGEAFDCGQLYRGYRYFDRYDEPQVVALHGLINELCDRFAIPRQVPAGFLDFHGDTLARFRGVIGHTMVRSDKTDPLPDPAFWQRVVRECSLTVVPAKPGNSDGGRMNDVDIEALYRSNAEQVGRMHPAAAGLVSALLDELERGGRKTYIRLRDPAGHKVGYDFVQGDRRLVSSLGTLLGFQRVSDSLLEVRSGR